MAGKKQAKKAGAKKAAKKAGAKKAGAKKAGAKKATPKRAAGKKKAGKKPARLGMGKPVRALSKGEVLEAASAEETDYSASDKAEKLGKHWERKWAKIVAKTWTDPEFKHQLLESPARTLAAEGLPLLKDVDVRIVSGEGRFTMEIPLPDRPGDLDGEAIDELLGDILDGDILKPKKCVMSSCCC